MYYESYHWAAIEEYFDDFLCFSTKPTKEKLDANYVFNEDKSVKWSSYSLKTIGFLVIIYKKVKLSLDRGQL